MAAITLEEAVNNATQEGGMTTQNWHDLIDSVVSIDEPAYGRTYFHDFVDLHGGLYGTVFTAWVMTVEENEDPIIPRWVWPTWAGICLNRLTQWTMMLRSMLFGGGGGVPSDGIYVPPYVNQYV
jgi:hypothetical protein